MKLGPWIGSRWVLVPGAMIAVTLVWLAYVNGHNHGIVEGRVVDATGTPVAGASVQAFPGGAALSAANGTYRVSVPPGTLAREVVALQEYVPRLREAASSAVVDVAVGRRERRAVGREREHCRRERH